MPLKRREGSDRFQFKKSCKFIGSLAITLLHGEERQSYVNEKLLEMKEVGKGISVVILVTDEGIKILKSDESAVKMAHGITRIAFSTCQPDKKLFAYVAKSQTSDGDIITQAHMFKTKKGQHTQELSSAISRAFKIAYTRNSTKRANRVNLFEMEAKDKEEVVNAKKKRWAKREMANGHEHSDHALRAKGLASKKGVSSDVQKLMDNLDINEERRADIQSANNDKQHQETSVEESENVEEIYGNDEIIIINYNINSNQTRRNVDNSSNNNTGSNDNQDIQSNAPVVPIPRPRISREEMVDTSSLRRDDKINCKNKDHVVAPVPKPRKISVETSGEDDFRKASGTARDDHAVSTVLEAPVPKPRNVLPTNEEGFDESRDRAISRESTALEDWDIIRLSTSSEHLPQKFAVPVTKFGTLEELDEDVDRLDEVFPADKVEMHLMTNEQLSSTFDLSRLTMTENQILQDAEWYQLGFSREIAETILQNRPAGSFFVRKSLSNPGCYVLTIKAPPTVRDVGCLNYLIENTADGFLRIRGFEAKFPSLLFLVAHYIAVAEDIPCRLYSSNSNPLFFLRKEDTDELDSGLVTGSQEVQVDFYDSDECSDADYENFSSNIQIMQELNELQQQG